jgi:rhodanese-related sulfurtransferase
MNPFGIPEMSVTEMADLREAGASFVVLDVREPLELRMAALDDVVHVPMSQIAALREDALPEAVLDKETEIVVLCHHGNRSAQVAAWLRAQGWLNVWNLTGGIDAYAKEVNRTIGLY